MTPKVQWVPQESAKNPVTKISSSKCSPSSELCTGIIICFSLTSFLEILNYLRRVLLVEYQNYWQVFGRVCSPAVYFQHSLKERKKPLG